MGKPENCDNCGLCCMGVNPMFDQAECACLPIDLGAALNDYQDSPRYSDGGNPCPWLDLCSGKCRHHLYRPILCREFESGGEHCLRMRKEAGIGCDTASGSEVRLESQASGYPRILVEDKAGRANTSLGSPLGAGDIMYGLGWVVSKLRWRCGTACCGKQHWVWQRRCMQCRCTKIVGWRTRKIAVAEGRTWPRRKEWKIIGWLPRRVRKEWSAWIQRAEADMRRRL